MKYLNNSGIIGTEHARIAMNAKFIAGTHFILPRAFESGKAGWKMSADGKSIEMKDGNPIWINESGAESVMAGDTVTRLNAEAKQHRETAETLTTQLAAFKDIDPAKAKAALETVGKLNAKQLIDAGEVDRVRNEISAQFTTQLTEKDKAIEALTGDLNGLRVDNIFDNSEFIRDRVATPRDFFKAAFRNNFKVDEKGNPLAYDKAGNRVMSAKKVGEYASPEEALEILVEQHPQKTDILRANQHSGTGNDGKGGNRPGGGRIVRRADFDAMNGTDKAATAAASNKGEVSIVD